MAIGKDEFPMRLRYGMRHTWRCECGTCMASFRTHGFKYGKCECEDCANTRLWQDMKRDVEKRNNLSPRGQEAKARKVHRHGPKCGFGEDIGEDCNSDSAIWETEERKTEVATVNFCEKHECETMAKSPAMGLVVIIPVTSGPEQVYADAVHTTDRNTVRLELCPGCVGELMDWVESGPAGERPKAYSKPWERAAKKDVPTSSSELFRLALEASKREMESGEVPE